MFPLQWISYPTQQSIFRASTRWQKLHPSCSSMFVNKSVHAMSRSIHALLNIPPASKHKRTHFMHKNSIKSTLHYYTFLIATLTNVLLVLLNGSRPWKLWSVGKVSPTNTGAGDVSDARPKKSNNWFFLMYSAVVWHAVIQTMFYCLICKHPSRLNCKC